MIKIRKILLEKTLYAQFLLKQENTYREIQEALKKKFGSGMSNTRLKELQEELSELIELRAENQELKKELQTYKNLYFELKDVLKNLN